MYFSQLLNAIWLAFLASNAVLASPVWRTNLWDPDHLPSKRALEKRGSDDAFRSGILQFGIEIETVLKLRPDGPAYSKFNPKFENLSTLKPSQNREEYNAFGKAVRQYLIDEWQRFDPFNPVLHKGAMQQHQPSEWLQKSKPMLQKTKREKPIMVDRWGEVYQKAEDYKTWIITRDGSIQTDDDAHGFWQFPIEFISPVFELGANQESYDQVRYQIEVFFDFLEQYGFQIIRNPTTSTHVHVSPKPVDGKWNVERAVRMASAALFFEPAIRSLLPPERHDNPYAKEWRHPMWLKSRKLDGENPLNSKDKVLNVISSQIDPRPATGDPDKKVKKKLTMAKLIRLMNPSPPDAEEDSDRDWGWNFLNLKEGESKGTIEFRRGGQSNNAAEAMFNIELVVGLSMAACASDDLFVQLRDGHDLKTGSLKTFIRGSLKGFTFPELENHFKTVPDDYDESLIILKYEDL